MDAGLVELQGMERRNGFLLGIDSDGCVFDTMEIKHKECFAPNTVYHWNMQPIASQAREAWEFVNLYSAWRGTNRFTALIKTLDMVDARPDSARRGYKSPEREALRLWASQAPKLSNPALLEEARRGGDASMLRALEWSCAVNDDIARIVKDVPPYPHARKALGLIKDAVDAVVVSATPGDALRREWNEHGISGAVSAIAGQEAGKKAECLATAMAKGYNSGRTLMIGDAPGDLAAARACGALFYPIMPGDEDRSWERFCNEAFGAFLAGEYGGRLAEAYAAEFLARLPETPPWSTEALQL